MQPFLPRSSTSPSLLSLDIAHTESKGKNGSGLRNELIVSETEASAQALTSAEGDVLREYEEKRDRLTKAIQSTSSLLADLRNLNDSSWTIRYPFLTPSTSSPTESSFPTSVSAPVLPSDMSTQGLGEEQAAVSRPAMAKRMRMSFVDSPDKVQEVELGVEGVFTSDGQERVQRRSMKRSLTVLPSLIESSDSSLTTAEMILPRNKEEDYTGFSILQLSLSSGPAHSSAHKSSSGGLINSLEKNSLSRLLNSRFEASMNHLTNLEKRVQSKNSRVLVTGDLNSGKSTFVNALLRRGGSEGGPEEDDDEEEEEEEEEEEGKKGRGGVMPVDQQPLTGRFVEVFGRKLKATGEKTGDEDEEVHVVKEGLTEDDYNMDDPSTYDVRKLTDLEELVADEVEEDETGESNGERKQGSKANAPPLKVYLRHPDQGIVNPSILHNNVLDISLIDAPGLNRDIIPTTSLFTKSPTIDVIIFVVSSLNHFTLSAKEYLLAAGIEKARMFIVVNRYDEVWDKKKCRERVLEQVKMLSPETWKERDELVHFVDSARVAMRYSEGVEIETKTKISKSERELDESFAKLESSLRSFVLVNRTKSKLGPAEHYLTHLLADVELLSSANALVAKEEMQRAEQEIDRVKPVLEGMKKGKDDLEDGLDKEEEVLGGVVMRGVEDGLKNALSRIGNGQLATQGGKIYMPSYPGLLGVWDYAAEVRRAMLKSIEYAIYESEENTKHLTTSSVRNVTEMGEKYLPVDVKKPVRVFNPDAMFASGRRPGSTGVGLGLRLGLTSKPEYTQVSMADIIDIHQYVLMAKSTLASHGGSNSTALSKSTEDSEISLLGYASLAVGALTMVGGKAMGVQSLVGSAMSLSDVVGSPSARKWAAPVAGAAVLGFTVYVIYDLPRSIPRNVGRHLQASLIAVENGNDTGVSFATEQVNRMSKEARKVIRLASWDLREKFKGAMESKGNVVRENEVLRRKAEKALEWFGQVENTVDVIRGEMGKSIA